MSGRVVPRRPGRLAHLLVHAGLEVVPVVPRHYLVTLWNDGGALLERSRAAHSDRIASGLFWLDDSFTSTTTNRRWWLRTDDLARS